MQNFIFNITTLKWLMINLNSSIICKGRKKSAKLLTKKFINYLIKKIIKELI